MVNRFGAAVCRAQPLRHRDAMVRRAEQECLRFRLATEIDYPVLRLRICV